MSLESRLNLKLYAVELLFKTLKVPFSSCSLMCALVLLIEKSRELANARLSNLPMKLYVSDLCAE